MSQICDFKKNKTVALHALHELFSSLYISQSFSSIPQRDLFCSCVNEVSTCRQLKIVSCNLPTAQINKFRDSCVANIFATQATWNNLKLLLQDAQSCVFRSDALEVAVCLESLLQRRPIRKLPLLWPACNSCSFQISFI